MAIVPATPYAANPAVTSRSTATQTSPSETQVSRPVDLQPRIGSAVLSAVISIAFIGAMLLAVETVVGVVLGSFLHSDMLGYAAVAILGLPTVVWLAFVRLPIAIRAERDAY